MMNVIDVLERVGRDSRLRHASDAELARTLEEASIDAPIREAILLRDRQRLETLIGASPNVCCMIHSPSREDDAGFRRSNVPDESGDDADEDQDQED